MKRFLWLLLLCAPAAWGYDNLLDNGDFSRLRQGDALPEEWSREIHTREGAAGEVTSERGALKIVHASDNAAWVRSSQQPVPAKPNHVYRFSCRARGSAHVRFIVYEFPGRSRPYDSHDVASGALAADWKTFVGVFRTGPGVRFFKVSLVTDSKGEAWFDDAELWDLSERPAAIAPRWPRKTRLAPFFVLDGHGKESSQPTAAWVGYDARGLRVRFECIEPQPAKMKIRAASDGMAVFGDDCVEIFLGPGPKLGDYYQIGVNPKGRVGYVRKCAAAHRYYRTWYDVGRRPAAPAWKPKTQVKTSIGKDRWTAQVFIPWSAIGVTPRPGLMLRANFTRRRWPRGEEENASWALMRGETFHDPSQWGALVLAADASKPAGRPLAAPKPDAAPTIPAPGDPKPAFAMRAFHTQAPLRPQLESYKALVRTLAKLRYNTLMIEVNEKMQYERHPDIAPKTALSKSEMRALVDYCRGLGFEVIPQVQTFGHFNYVLRHPAYRSLAENADAAARGRAWCYCPSNPDTYKLVFDLFEEVIEVFRPKRLHIGHDEITFQPIGVCPRCQGTPAYKLFARDVVKLHGWLKARGLATMMWGDQLLAEHNGRPPYNTAKALPNIPRDIIICDWHYAAADDFPSVRFFKQHGFPVVACGWFHALNVANFTRVAAAAGAEGYCMTTWYGIQHLARTARLQAAMALSAQFAWAPKRYTLDSLPWRPAQAFRLIHFGPRKPGVYRALDLAAQARTPVAATPLKGAPQGALACNAVPYLVTNRVVVLNAARPKAWQIPVGSRAASLFFLHCTSRPAKVVDHLYDRRRVRPGRVGRIIVHYADGSTSQASLTYLRNITHWNSKLGAGESDLVWQGHRPDGALLTLCAWEWRNPRPDQAIAGIDVERQSDQVDLFLLAITAAGPF